MSESHPPRTPDQSAVRDAARELYESTLATFDQVGADLGVSGRTVKRWAAADGGWSKLSGPEITARAQATADRINRAVTDLGAEAGRDQRQAITAQLREDAAISQRAQILDRHRQELNAPRKLLYEAMGKRDAELVKLAKYAAETLRIMQDSERKAWGLDPASDDMHQAITVVIERDG